MADGGKDVTTGRRTVQALHLGGAVSFYQLVESVVYTQTQKTIRGRVGGKAEGCLVCPTDECVNFVAFRVEETSVRKAVREARNDEGVDKAKQIVFSHARTPRTDTGEHTRGLLH